MLDPVTLGDAIARHRRARGLSVGGLSERAAVSPSMLSAVERAEKTPTVIVLDKIARGLGLSLTQLIADLESDPVVVVRAADRETLDEPGGWRRSVLSPVIPGVGFEWIRTTLPPGCDAGTFPAWAPGSHEFVHVQSGKLRLTIDSAEHDLSAGDTAYFPADVTHRYANFGRVQTTYFVAALTARRRTASPPR